jgi:hypothetical protein
MRKRRDTTRSLRSNDQGSGGNEQIPNTHSGFEIPWMNRIGLQFAPQAIDIDLEHMTFPYIITPPNMF